MKTTKKILVLSALTICICISNVLTAQTDKNELKLQKLKENVIRYEARVTAKERKMEIADSLLITGENMLFEAEDEFEEVEDEQAILDKEYKSDYKMLAKLQRSKDKETSEEAENDLKALELRYKTDTKAIDTRIKVLTRKATKGQANMAKGKEKFKAASNELKDAEEALSIARDKYEAALN